MYGESPNTAGDLDSGILFSGVQWIQDGKKSDLQTA